MPKILGFWVLVAAGGELMNYGRDGDTKHPFGPRERKEVEKQAHYLANHEDHVDDTVYIMQLFVTGQMIYSVYEPS